MHGRFLVRPGPPEKLLVGFHGYAETAEIHMEELLKIPGTEAWTIVAVQALHPFYTSRDERIVASWMTRLDREMAIEDNKAYVRGVLDDFHQPPTVVFAGFSQGGAMAYRAAADSRRAAGVIVLAADVPQDVASLDAPVLIGRGERDHWYTDEKLKKDLTFLARAEVCTFDGAHEWTDEFRAAASRFLERVR